MKLDTKTHIIIYDLLDCYETIRGVRVRNSLLAAMGQVLATALDPEVHYTHTGVKVADDFVLRGAESVAQLKFFMFPNGNEDAPAEMVHTINIQSGVYTTEGSPK